MFDFIETIILLVGIASGILLGFILGKIGE
jgi:hypothetical protein